MLFLLGLSLWGCTYSPPPPPIIVTPSREVFTIRSKALDGTDSRNHYLNVRTNQFGAGETPCVLVKGYSGETITVSQIPYLCYPSLGNGSFKANVFLHGVLSGTTTFGVSR
jgi:hypothetical protein